MNNSLLTVHTELETASQLPKCQKCGCMQETLDNLSALLPTISASEIETLAGQVETWRQDMQLVKYSCLGCEHCYPAVAQNKFATAFPSVDALPALSCEIQVDEGWPPVVGEYFVIDKSAAVAVSTLADVELAEHLARQKTDGLAIVGKTETENIGIDKIIKNVITNPAIQFLIVAGRDSKGHQTGKTLLALAENGVDDKHRVIGSPGKRPILQNVSADEIASFREQVQIIDMIGCDDVAEIGQHVEQLAQQAETSCGCRACDEGSPTVEISTTPVIAANAADNVVTMDKAGYFVIVPLVNKGLITVEHYAYDHNLLRVIEGENAAVLYKTIVAGGWVTELSHAAYIGKELAKAELSLEYDFKYVQDGA